MNPEASERDQRLDTIIAIWSALAFALAALFISAAAAQGLSLGHVLLALALLMAATGMSRTILNYKRTTETTEKSKRRSLEDALRNLSDTDLESLRDRLHDDHLDDELLEAYLADAMAEQDQRR